jgi:hypothetical protein
MQKYRQYVNNENYVSNARGATTKEFSRYSSNNTVFDNNKEVLVDKKGRMNATEGVKQAVGGRDVHLALKEDKQRLHVSLPKGRERGVFAGETRDEDRTFSDNRIDPELLTALSSNPYANSITSSHSQ